MSYALVPHMQHPVAVIQEAESVVLERRLPVQKLYLLVYSSWLSFMKCAGVQQYIGSPTNCLVVSTKANMIRSATVTRWLSRSVVSSFRWFFNSGTPSSPRDFNIFSQELMVCPIRTHSTRSYTPVLVFTLYSFPGRHVFGAFTLKDRNHVEQSQLGTSMNSRTTIELADASAKSDLELHICQSNTTLIAG